MELLQCPQGGGHAVQVVEAQIHRADVLELVQLHGQPIRGQPVVTDIEIQQGGHLPDGFRKLVDVVAVQVEPSQVLKLGDGVWDFPDHIPAKVELIHLIETQDTLGEGGDPHLAQIKALSPIKGDFDAILGHTECDLFALGAFSTLDHDVLIWEYI